MAVNRNLTYEQIKNMVDTKKLYTPFEVEQMGIVSQVWIMNRIKNGKLKANIIGKRISYFSGSDLLLTISRDPYFFKRTSSFKELINGDPIENEIDIDDILKDAKEKLDQFQGREISFLMSLRNHFKEGLQFMDDTFKKLGIDLKAA